MTRKDAERQEAIQQLREWIKPGDTVYTILRHVSRSGMQREIGVVLLDGKTDLHPNYSVAKAIRARQGKADGVVMGGCGMDMGFALVHQLGYTLFPEGFGCIGKDCPSNDHSNHDRNFTPHGCMDPSVHPPGVVSSQARNRPQGVCTDDSWNDHWHKSGGYALKQRWL